MNILVLNPGGNSLKIDVVACGSNQRYAFEARKLISVSIEGIGKKPKLSRLEGKKSVHSESIEAPDYASATESFLNWYENVGDDLPDLTQIDRAAVTGATLPDTPNIPDWPTFAQWAARYMNDGRPVIAPGQSFTLGEDTANNVGIVTATDPDSGDTLQSWQVKGGTGAYKFTIDPNTGNIIVADASAIDFANTPSYTLTLFVGDGKLPSHDEGVTINIPDKINLCHKGLTISVSKNAASSHVAHGDEVGTCSSGPGRSDDHGTGN